MPPWKLHRPNLRLPTGHGLSGKVLYGVDQGERIGASIEKNPDEEISAVASSDDGLSEEEIGAG